MSAGPQAPPGPSRGKISVVLLLLAMLGVASGVALWKLPQRFPLSSPRFYTNTALPIAVVALVLIGFVAVIRGRHAFTGALCAALAAVPAGALAGMFVVFPESAPGLPWWSFGIAAACAAVLLALRGWLRRGLIVMPAIGGALLGVLLTVALRAPEPSTRPANVPLPSDVPLPGGVPLPEHWMSAAALGPHMRLSARHAQLSHRGQFDLTIEPMLTFESRSPDRMWTVLAPPLIHFHPRQLLGALQRGSTLEARYETAAAELLRLTPIGSSESGDGDGESVRIEAWTILHKPVYAHLDTYTDIFFVTRGRPMLRLSPCGSAPIEIHSTSCEQDEPVRFGALYPDGVFRVNKTTDDEKGPFETICEGPLARDEPLTLVFSEDGTERARLNFHDWAAQASTALSPTAGWGVPQNAVTLLGACGRSTAVAVRLSLAATGIGRGWDTVGHAAGGYRNRIDMRIAAPTGSEGQPGG